MTFEDVLKTIKSKGYWRISFEPLVYKEQSIPISKCKELIEKNSLQLRGWDYPHMPQRQDEESRLEVGANYWQGWLDWQGEQHKEFWRMYQSGQFIHYLALREDWIDGLRIRNMLADDTDLDEGGGIGAVATTYQITEIFEFLLRLISDGLYDKGVKVSIQLNNTRGRQLFVDAPGRIGFSYIRKTSADSIPFEKIYTKEEMIESSKDKAFETIIYFFERFGWENPNVEVIKSDQENLLSRKI